MANVRTAACPLLASDVRSWTQILTRYREPNHVRSTVEIVITFVPLATLWALAWAALHFGYWWLSLILAVPAAGFLVRLFMIQHDCGHGSFFRHRLANDWVGRVIGVVTLTPYDFWRRTHAMHHAGSGHLERRGIGDVDTLTVHEYLLLCFWGRLRYRAYRNPLVMFGIGPAYLFILRYRLPFGLLFSGWQPWLSTMATNVGIAAVAAGLIWFIGVWPFLLVQLPIILLAGSVGVWLFYVQHQFEMTFWAHEGGWTLRKRPCMAARTTTFRESCAGSRRNRRAPCPPPMQPHSVLPPAAGAPRPSRASRREPAYAASELSVRAPRALGRESAASHFLS